MTKNLINIFILLIPFAIPAHAQITVQELIEQTGIEASNQATRDMPGWTGVDKVILRNGVLDVDAARRTYPDIEFVTVRSESDALKEAADADAYIGGCSATLIEAAENLIWVQRMSAGVEQCIDIPRIADGSTLLTNMQKMDSPAIAEHAIAMMMTLARRLPRFVREMETGTWARNERANMQSVAGKKLLVVGLGGIGTEAARLGNALGMHVSATRNSSRVGPPFVDYVGLSNELHTLAAESDVIISALPLTDSTTNLYDKTFFEGLKPNAIFINVGRGKSVVTDDLFAALQSGELAAAGLDVTEPEPLPSDHPLWTLANVIITPHVSSAGGERERRAVLIQENLKRFIAGDALLNVVDPKKGY